MIETNYLTNMNTNICFANHFSLLDDHPKKKSRA